MTKARELAELGDVVTVDSGNVILNKSGGAYLQLKDASAVRGSINVETSDGLVFTTGSSFTERVRIDSSGNVTVKSSGELRIRDDGTFIKEDQGLLIGNTSGTGTTRPIRFFTESAERARIHSNGNTSFATTSDLGGTIGVVTTSGNWAMRVRDSESNSAFIRFDNSSGTQVGAITRSGSSTVYGNSSDHRLKENVVDVTDGITRLKQLEPKRFNFIADEDDTTVDGFIAHEVQTVVPEAITGTHNEVDSEGEPVYQCIDQSKLVPLLTAALQEAVAKIETLETKVAALEAE